MSKAILMSINPRWCELIASGQKTIENGGHMRSNPPSYRFTIRGDKDGEVVEYTFEVTAEEYSAYKIGEVYHR